MRATQCTAWEALRVLVRQAPLMPPLILLGQSPAGCRCRRRRWRVARPHQQRSPGGQVRVRELHWGGQMQGSSGWPDDIACMPPALRRVVLVVGGGARGACWAGKEGATTHSVHANLSSNIVITAVCPLYDNAALTGEPSA